MKLPNVTLLIVLITVFALGGCASVPDAANPDAGNAADQLHADLNSYTKVNIDVDDTQGRLLRAYFLITVFSVYGNASIDRYSHGPSGDAGGLLGRVMAAEAALQTALDDASKNYYPVDRARLVYSIADLAARAVRPTVTMFTGLIGTTPAAGAAVALDVFRNAVKDVVFGEAYLQGFRRSICELNTGKPCTSAQPSVTLTSGAAADLTKPAWTDLNAMLKATCDELKRKAKLGTNSPMQCGNIGVKPGGKG